MDFLKVPRELIYRDRNNLNDFRVKDEKSINYVLFRLLKPLPLMHVEGAKKYALECFNNAYYICTLIQLEEFPDLCTAEYEKELLKMGGKYPHDVCSASMGMVYHLLSAYDDKYDADSDLLKRMYQMFGEGKWLSIMAYRNFYTIVDGYDLSCFPLPHNVFDRRDIIEAIEHVGVEVLTNQPYYVNELLSYESDSKRRKYGAELAVTRVDEYLQEVRDMESISSAFDYDNDATSIFEVGIKAIKEYEDNNLLPKKYVSNSFKETKAQPLKEEKKILLPDSDPLQAQAKKMEDEYNAEKITDINNRPSENITPVIPDNLLNVDDDDEEEWDNQYDGVFESRIDPQIVFKKLEFLDDPRVTEAYPRFFVFFKVLVYLGWIENHQRNFLNWANCHWNCNWKYGHNFKFGNNIKKELRDTHMSKWNGNTLPNSDIGNAYRSFAIKVLSELTEKVNGGKIIDRIAFYRVGVTERINDGKKKDYPF